MNILYKTFKKCYIDNLSKGLELLADRHNYEEVKNIVCSTEEETGFRVGLKQENKYKNVSCLSFKLHRHETRVTAELSWICDYALFVFITRGLG